MANDEKKVFEDFSNASDTVKEVARNLLRSLALFPNTRTSVGSIDLHQNVQDQLVENNRYNNPTINDGNPPENPIQLKNLLSSAQRGLNKKLRNENTPNFQSRLENNLENNEEQKNKNENEIEEQKISKKFGSP